MSIVHKGMLIVLSAPSGGGKSTVVKAILESDPNIEYSVSATSRPPRKGEVDGESYYFLSTEEFERLIEEDKFLEWAVVHNHYYGTRRDIIEEKLQRNKDIILDLDFQGGLTIKRKIPDSVLIFLLPPSMDILEKRLRKRQLDSEETIQLRLQNAANEIKYASQYDYVVVNDELEETVFIVRRIIEAERYKSNHLKICIENEPGLVLEREHDSSDIPPHSSR
ncbi:guanylate kinase [Candidatus Sumerlaeota bacterium]|nr:guanylate kinase [Candidatus Sumerlaeota bacterium]